LLAPEGKKIAPSVFFSFAELHLVKLRVITILEFRELPKFERKIEFGDGSYTFEE
jgi:hypothetical protein